MSHSFAGKTNLEAFFKTYAFMFSKVVGWNKFHTSFTFPLLSLLEPVTTNDLPTIAEMVGKSLVFTGSMSVLELNGIIYNTDERTISLTLGLFTVSLEDLKQLTCGCPDHH